MNGIFKIVEVADPSDPTNSALVLDSKNNEAQVHDLLQSYSQLSVEDVTTSNCWYHSFTDRGKGRSGYDTDMKWSY
ncbi:MAG: hypothetical protein AAFY00_12940, partial [Bacteroidota bacterium]